MRENSVNHSAEWIPHRAGGMEQVSQDMQQGLLHQAIDIVSRGLPWTTVKEFIAMIIGIAIGGFLGWCNNEINKLEVTIERHTVIIAGCETVIDLLERQKAELESKAKVQP